MITKVVQKSSHRSFNLNVKHFKMAKKSPNILAIYGWKFIAKKIKKSPNLVTLLTANLP